MLRRMAIVLILCLLAPGAAQAEEMRVRYGSVTVSAQATRVDLGRQKVEDWDAFYAFLDALEQVEQVDMFETVVERRDIERLTAQYPGITFGWTIHIAQDHYVRTDQTAFSTLHGRCTNHTSREFDVLRYCTKMQALDLGHNHVKSLSFLEGMPELRVLIIACNPELRSLEALRGLKQLEYLEVFSCNVADLTPLKDLPRLQHLNVANNPIRTWQALKEMPQLKRLWVAGCPGISRGEGYEQLLAALPGTQIVRGGHPTAGGWREGHHYGVIREMFAGTVYIPFQDSFPAPSGNE